MLIQSLLMLAVVTIVSFVEATLPQNISYYVTVRSFMASGCQAGQQGNNICPKATTDHSLIASNIIAGHADFERNFPNNQHTNGHTAVYNSTHARFNQQFPVVTPGGSLRPVVLSTLVPDTTGILKMQYCSNSAEGVVCDGDLTGINDKRSVLNAQSFSTWYTDSARFNRRSGYKQVLSRRKNTLDKFGYTASNQTTQTPDDDDKVDDFYDPISENGLFGFDISQQEMNVPRDAGDPFKKFWFTTEIHATFEYKGTESFTFSGDDDVHVFINRRLAINLGGVHGDTAATIDLPKYARELDLQLGKVYEFDLFHAERQISQSNYALTTTLAETCNVVTSDARTNGQDVERVIDWRVGQKTLNSDWFVLAGPGYGTFAPSGKSMNLMLPNNRNALAYMFHRSRQNVGSGFALSFKFTMTNFAGHGFSVLFHDRPEGLTDLNGGTGPNLGIKNLENSFGILFDMCPEYPSPCTAQQVRIHYKGDGNRLNSPSLATRRVFDANVLQKWNDNVAHFVEIFYYEIPDFLEVYVDSSLRLVEKNFNVNRVIGGRDAHVGFAATSSETVFQQTVRISEVVMTTVKVVDRFASLSAADVSAQLPKQFVANNRDKLQFTLTSKDACKTQVQFGGLQDRVFGLLVPTRLRSENPNNRRLRGLAASSSPNGTINGTVVDNNNGEYTLQFTTDLLADFSVHLAFGKNCVWNGTAFVSNVNCFALNVAEAATSVPFSPLAPTDEGELPFALGSAALTGIGIGAGIVFGVGSMLLIVGVRTRNQWRRDKQFVEAGRLAAMEKGMNYEGDNELDALQNRLQQTIHALQAERAKKARIHDQQDTIDELLRQKGELQEMVRRMKIRQIGGDPDAPEYNQTQLAMMGTRVRKSFAAARVVSNRMSMSRMSRGISMNLGGGGTQQMYDGAGDASNAGAFSKMRSSVSRNFARMYTNNGPPGLVEPSARMDSSGSADVYGTPPLGAGAVMSSNPMFAKLLATKPKPPPVPSKPSFLPGKIDEEL